MCSLHLTSLRSTDHNAKGCEQATAAYVARHMKPRLPLRGLTFDYQGYRDNRGAVSLPLERTPPAPAQLSRVAGVAVVHLTSSTTTGSAAAAAAAGGGGGGETPERIDELRRLVEARCPVASTLSAAGCRLDITWRMATADDAFDDDDE